MLTLADVEEKHEKLKREMRLIRRAIRIQQDTDGLAEKLDQLRQEARFLIGTIEKQRRITEYLINAEPYGGIQ